MVDMVDNGGETNAVDELGHLQKPWGRTQTGSNGDE
jgi:hypothetical protein